MQPLFRLIVMAFMVSESCSEVVSINFRDSAVINDTLIRMSDIATIKTADHQIESDVLNSIIGEAAPAGFSRFITTDDLILFRLQPRFKTASFKTSGCRRVFVKTDFKEIQVKDLSQMISAYLDSSVLWPAGSWSYSIENGEQKIKCLNVPFSLKFQQLQNRYPKGESKLALVIEQGTKDYRVPISCYFRVSLPVLVAVNQIDRGSPVLKSDCELRTADITRYGPNPYLTINEVIGKMANRTILPGTILNSQLMKQIPVIEKGQEVYISLERGKVKIEVAAVARENGSIGDKIWVENSKSHKLIRVEVKGKGTVVLIQGGETI
jgi:flagella basal body P-ring formation protein FlgA